MFKHPRESAELISIIAEHVSIDPDSIKKFARKIFESNVINEFDLRRWRSDNPLHPQTITEHTADWIFLIDSLNFSFWPDSGHEFTIGGEIGYWALCFAIKRALTQNIPITDPKFYCKITLEQVKNLFRTDNQREIPMINERFSILRENGKILVENFQGSFVNCIRQSQSNAITLLKLIYDNFPSFRDEFCYRSVQVTFLKRAQILIADIWACYEGHGLGFFNDIDQLTMFADYRIPQILHYFDILKYSPELTDSLWANNLLNYGDQYEIEIRGQSINAIEKIRLELRRLFERESIGKFSVPNSIQIDFYLWSLRRSISDLIDLKSPYHKVRSIYY
ncbi:DUF2419 domain containing protein [Sarcoptes scabiei]|uniref:Queuosine 5'-phosphate N-glycosylase/hydrolase n=1 Tax=Sarcoptes scabiei TaxID=52283 RepID=A0A132AH90_SARSC|nr:DUF2419 domain containing protein [Sarcoptes scabiei]